MKATLAPTYRAQNPLGHPPPNAPPANATNDAQAVGLWLSKFTDVPNTFSAYRKESERFLLWLTSKQKTLQQCTVADVLNYREFLLDPQPRAIWCLEQERKTLPSGEINPKYTPAKKPAHYFPSGRLNPAWKPFTAELSPPSQKYAMSVLFNLCEFLVAIDYLPINPCRAARKRTTAQPKEVVRYIEKEKLISLLAALEKLPEALEVDYLRKERAVFIIKFLYLTGLRRSELANLQWENIQKSRGLYWLNIKGKGGKIGSVPLNTSALEAINRYRKANHRGDFDGADIGPVLLSLDKSKGLSPQGLHGAIKEALQATKDPQLLKVSAHWFRHSAASHMLFDAGVPLAAVRDNLRHASISTTSLYIHTAKDKRHAETEAHGLP